MRRCGICGESFSEKSGHFTRHLKRAHDISLEEYVVRFVHGGAPPKCKCGLCEERPVFYRGAFREYAKGHRSFSWREAQYKRLHGAPTCRCCGSEVKFRRGEPLKFCSYRCSGKHAGFSLDQTQRAVRRTVEERYGVSNVSELPEVRAKISAALTGRERSPISDEVRENHSKASKKMWQDAAYRLKVIAGVQEAVNRPGVREARSLRMKRRWADPTYRAGMLMEMAQRPNRVSGLHRKVRDYLNLEELGFESEVVVGRYIVDEVHRKSRVILEVYGDYVHANPKLYSAEDVISLRGRSNSYTAAEKWAYDASRLKYLRALGYTVVVVWETDDWSQVVLPEGLFS